MVGECGPELGNTRSEWHTWIHFSLVSHFLCDARQVLNISFFICKIKNRNNGRVYPIVWLQRISGLINVKHLEENLACNICSVNVISL